MKVKVQSHLHWMFFLLLHYSSVCSHDEMCDISVYFTCLCFSSWKKSILLFPVKTFAPFNLTIFLLFPFFFVQMRNFLVFTPNWRHAFVAQRRDFVTSGFLGWIRSDATAITSVDKKCARMESEANFSALPCIHESAPHGHGAVMTATGKTSARRRKAA